MVKKMVANLIVAIFILCMGSFISFAFGFALAPLYELAFHQGIEWYRFSSMAMILFTILITAQLFLIIIKRIGN